MGPQGTLGFFLKDVVKEVACDKIAPWWGGGLYTDVVRMEYRGEGGSEGRQGGLWGANYGREYPVILRFFVYLCIFVTP